MLGGSGGGDLSNLLNPAATAGGYTSSGFNDQRPPGTDTVLRPEADMEPREPGHFQEVADVLGKVNKKLDTPLGKLATGMYGTRRGDRMSRRRERDRMEYLEKKGLTPWEIAGQGSAGGAISSSGNTLGTGPATQLASQQEFQAEQAALERQNKKDIAEIAARAPGREQDRKDFMLPYTMHLTRAQAQQAYNNGHKLLAEYQMVDTQHRERWEMKLAGMGPENILAALALFQSGLSAREVLSRQAESGVEVKEAQRIVDSILELRSRINIEKAGAMDIFDELANLGSSFVDKIPPSELGVQLGHAKRDFFDPRGGVLGGIIRRNR